MTALAYSPDRHMSGVPVVICGPTLVNTYQNLQSDFDCTICLSADLQSGMHAAETFAPSVLIIEEEALHDVDLGAMRIRLALARSVRVMISVWRASEVQLRELLCS